MTWQTQVAIVNSLQVVTMLIGIIRIKHLDNASKTLLVYIVLSTSSELLATYTAIHYHNNLVVLNIFSLIEYLVTCLYFQKSIPAFRLTKVISILLIGIAVWIFTTLSHPIHKQLNTPFLVFESTTIIGLCHYYFYDLLNADDNRIITPSFGFVSFLFIFWSFTFTYWLFGLTLRTGMQEQGVWLGRLIWIINLVCYSGFSLVFLFYKKLQNR